MAFLDAIADKFDIDPTGEDEADACGVDGNCDDGDCDGVAEDVNPDCVQTISGPTGKKNEVDPRYVVFEADILAAGVSCTPAVFVVTKQLSSGKGKNATQKYAPDACDIATTWAGGSLAGMITLNPGLSVIDRVTNDLISGPHGPILATASSAICSCAALSRPRHHWTLTASRSLIT